MATEVERRARALIDAPFRLHGRDPVTGIDCVGVAADAFGIAEVPRGYAVRTADAKRVAGTINASGLIAVARAPEPGDLMLLRSGPAQCHLAVRTTRGFVHADAGLGRVVEVPGAPTMPVLAVWTRYEGER